MLCPDHAFESRSIPVYRFGLRSKNHACSRAEAGSKFDHFVVLRNRKSVEQFLGHAKAARTQHTLTE